MTVSNDTPLVDVPLTATEISLLLAALALRQRTLGFSSNGEYRLCKGLFAHLQEQLQRFDEPAEPPLVEKVANLTSRGRY